MQLLLQLSRLDKMICYSTFCDDQLICLICISIFVVSVVIEDSNLTGVDFFHLPTTIPTYFRINTLVHDIDFASSCV